jgi:hypothetical protein
MRLWNEITDAFFGMTLQMILCVDTTLTVFDAGGEPKTVTIGP